MMEDFFQTGLETGRGVAKSTHKFTFLLLPSCYLEVAPPTHAKTMVI